MSFLFSFIEFKRKNINAMITCVIITINAKNVPLIIVVQPLLTFYATHYLFGNLPFLIDVYVLNSDNVVT
uniref:Uncharacterized protein n=1 Tax=Schistosoma curassoni TaxID=6186 RepID=A0A183K7H8_9TREM